MQLSLLIKVDILHCWSPKDSPRPNLSQILYHFFSIAQCLYSPVLNWNKIKK